MAQNYAYAYAFIDLNTGMCLGVQTQTHETSDPRFVAIPVYDENYAFKFYNQSNGQWYEDAAFTIPWQSSLI